MDSIKKWTTKCEYVDIETGELISKRKAKVEYLKLNTRKKIEIKEDGYGIKTGYITYTIEIQRSRQIRLF